MIYMLWPRFLFLLGFIFAVLNFYLSLKDDFWETKYGKTDIFERKVFWLSMSNCTEMLIKPLSFIAICSIFQALSRKCLFFGRSASLELNSVLLGFIISLFSEKCTFCNFYKIFESLCWIIEFTEFAAKSANGEFHSKKWECSILNMGK